MRGMQKHSPTTGARQHGPSRRVAAPRRGAPLTAQDLLHRDIRSDHPVPLGRSDRVRRGGSIRVGIHHERDCLVGDILFERARHELRPDRAGDGGSEGGAEVVRGEVETGHDGHVWT